MTMAEEPQERAWPRKELLEEAIRLTTGDRNVSYGPPTADFDRTAALWTIIFADLLKDGAAFESHHVAMGIIQVKQSRLVWAPGNRDSWTDIAGYAGCGWECSIEDAKR